jgi:hypothetical protein
MKIKILKSSIYLLTVITLFIACNDDDDVIPLEARDRAEQQIADKDSILNYLSTHYYNSGFLETGVNHKFTEIIITELQFGEELPDGHTLLIEDVETHMAENLEVDYEYYILRLNQGEGPSPRFTDFVRVRYEGSSIGSEEVFDSSIAPFDQLLQGNGITTSGAIKAWQLVMPEFNSSSNFTTNNGAVDFTDFGLGVMFVPSGLAYFSGTNTGSSYDNIIFKFELLQVEELDHDNDGIPSYVEDLDMSLEVFDDDTDDNSFPDFIDIDDDGDEVLTINELMPNAYTVNSEIGEEEPVLATNEYEISRNENAGIVTINTVTIVDSNNDGTPDYLDETITINYNEDEDS